MTRDLTQWHIVVNCLCEFPALEYSVINDMLIYVACRQFGKQCQGLTTIALTSALAV